MTLAASPPPIAPQPLAPSRGETRIVLAPVSWSLYQQILRELGDRRSKRLTYDSGRLEIMSPSDLHEDVKTVAARLLETYALLMRIKVQGYGSMTMDREDLEKGLEPDECYYVQSFDRLPRGRRLDLSTDPPPDLAIEVDISPPSIARQPIYAALSVPEVWLYDGRSFIVLRRTADGRYAEARQSECFPSLPIDEFNRFVRIGLESNQPAALEALMDWLRETQQQVRPL